MVYSYVGYESTEQTVDLSADTRVNINLQATDRSPGSGHHRRTQDENISGTEMGTVTLGIEQVKSIPVLFGKQISSKTLQLLPGVGGRRATPVLCERRRTGSEPHLIRRSGGL